ncbi:hypothetical protein PKF022_11910 [Polynucleobacter sp. KF022]|nr:hypothetical protein PKF022_11910 [Polynucleobacter sp. KF022]
MNIDILGFIYFTFINHLGKKKPSTCWVMKETYTLSWPDTPRQFNVISDHDTTMTNFLVDVLHND